MFDKCYFVCVHHSSIFKLCLLPWGSRTPLCFATAVVWSSVKTLQRQKLFVVSSRIQATYFCATMAADWLHRCQSNISFGPTKLQHQRGVWSECWTWIYELCKAALSGTKDLLQRRSVKWGAEGGKVRLLPQGLKVCSECNVSELLTPFCWTPSWISPCVCASAYLHAGVSAAVSDSCYTDLESVYCLPPPVCLIVCLTLLPVNSSGDQPPPPPPPPSAPAPVCLARSYESHSEVKSCGTVTQSNWTRGRGLETRRVTGFILFPHGSLERIEGLNWQFSLRRTSWGTTSRPAAQTAALLWGSRSQFEKTVL